MNKEDTETLVNDLIKDIIENAPGLAVMSQHDIFRDYLKNRMLQYNSEIGYPYCKQTKTLTEDTCVRCGKTKSYMWWKCCPTHTPFNFPIVVCHTCKQKLHPNG